MSEAIFDTNIIIDYLRGVSNSRPLIEKVRTGAISGGISVLTETEIFAGKDAGDPKKREILEGLLDIFVKVDVSDNIAKTAGDLKRHYGISLVDAIIAATASNMRCVLLTNNTKDFAKVKEIRSEKPY